MTTAAKPVSSAFTLYFPGKRFEMRYSPRSFVIDALDAPVSRFVAVTDTPGSTAFDSSVAVPRSEACCARAADAAPRLINTIRDTATPLARMETSFQSVGGGGFGQEAERRRHTTTVSILADATWATPSRVQA